MLHRSTSTEPDHLDVELVATRAVGRALAALGDPEARLRVLRWANEQCQIESMFAPPVEAPPVVAQALVPAAPVLRLAVGSAPDAALRFAAAPEHGAPALRLAPAPEVDEFEPEFEPQVGLSLDLEFEPAQPATDLRVDNLEDLFEAGTSPSPSFLEEEGMLLGEGEDVSGLDHGAELEDLSDLYECEPPSAETFEEPIDLCEPPPQEPAQPPLRLVTRDEDQPFEQLIDDLVDNLQRLSDECLDA